MTRGKYHNISSRKEYYSIKLLIMKGDINRLPLKMHKLSLGIPFPIKTGIASGSVVAICDNHLCSF
jgi:hypothetical protein